MITIYPFASGSLYTASYAITSSYTVSASLINFAITSSTTDTVLFPRSGSRGNGICLLTTNQYEILSSSIGSLTPLTETCNFPA